MCSNHMLFDALTLPVSNEALGESSYTCAHNKGEKFCLKDVFLCQFQLLQHSVPFYALKDFCPRKS